MSGLCAWTLILIPMTPIMIKTGRAGPPVDPAVAKLDKEKASLDSQIKELTESLVCVTVCGCGRVCVRVSFTQVVGILPFVY